MKKHCFDFNLDYTSACDLAKELSTETELRNKQGDNFISTPAR